MQISHNEPQSPQVHQIQIQWNYQYLINSHGSEDANEPHNVRLAPITEAS